jgi:hypothetical protein
MHAKFHQQVHWEKTPEKMWSHLLNAQAATATA